MTKKNLISIVVPLFNERESLTELVRSTDAAFRQGKVPIEYIFVDDGSTDGSFALLTSLRAKEKNSMTIVRLRKRSGKSAALSEGFMHTRGDIVVTMDADLQDDPAEAYRLVGKMNSTTDLIVGWRKNRMDSQGKLGVSRLFNRAVSVSTGLRLHDMNCGLKVMRSGVTHELDIYGELHRFIPVLAHARGFRVTEAAISHRPRKYGASKFGIERVFAAFDLLSTLFLAGFGTRPLIIFGPIGSVMVLLGLVALVYLSAIHFMGQSIGTRPLLLLGVMFVIFGVQLLSTGLLGELIISSSTGRKRASVEQIIKPL
ncbi:glycosyltransferase family 2 protein [Candidatus Gottesmanbacteria bacterium]|nr:glycosyltransferase family 2 protein [Candidatus Gottesmanbacteria bacterium]